MYQRIETSGPLVALRLGESLTADEINQLYAEVGDALERHARISYYVDATGWSHIGLEAGLEGLKQRLAHLGWLTRFDRVVIVSDNPLIKGMVGLFDLLTPHMQMKCFAAADADAGLDWAKAG